MQFPRKRTIVNDKRLSKYYGWKFQWIKYCGEFHYVYRIGNLNTILERINEIKINNSVQVCTNLIAMWVRDRKSCKIKILNKNFPKLPHFYVHFKSFSVNCASSFRNNSFFLLLIVLNVCRSLKLYKHVFSM